LREGDVAFDRCVFSGFCFSAGAAAGAGGIASRGCVLSGLCFSEEGAEPAAFSSSICAGFDDEALFSSAGGVANGCV
jgi:hypothetical protein